MAKGIMDLVLPRLAKPLYRQLEKFQTGLLDESGFTAKFEAVLQKQHAWLSRKGVDAARGAIAIHAAVLVLSQPGLRAEAGDAGLPLEVLEQRAVREAAQDVAETYGLPFAKVAHAISRLVARYSD